MRAILLVAIVLGITGPSLFADWTRFRGPNGSGVSQDKSVPTEWSAEKNLRWRTALPGKGSSSPVVADGKVFLTAYTGYGLDPANRGEIDNLQRHLIAFDEASGDELWRHTANATANEDPYQGFITQHGYASSTPATDGEIVVAVLGKSGLFAFSTAGEKLWEFDIGQKSDPARWGDGSSPIIVDDVVIVDAGVLGNSFIGLDKTSGELLWKIDDAGYTNAWATPVTTEVAGMVQVLFNVPKNVVAVDPSSGEKLWTAASPLDDAACGSIVLNGNKAYLMGSRAGRAIAIQCGGSGDVSETNTLWKQNLRSGIVTPLVVGDSMYWTSGGVFYAARLSDGEYVYKERLPRLSGSTGGFPNADYSSPIAVGGNIYLFTRNGESYVIKPGSTFEVVSHNPGFSDDQTSFNSTPAVSDGKLFVRSEGFLYCIAAPE